MVYDMCIMAELSLWHWLRTGHTIRHRVGKSECVWSLLLLYPEPLTLSLAGPAVP